MRAIGRLALSLALATMAAGCGGTRACKAGTLLVTVGGDAPGADTLSLDIAIGGGSAKTVAVNWRASGGTVEIDFPSGYPRGQSVAVTATALAGGVPVSTANGSATLDASCGTLALVLVGNGGVPDLGDGDAAAAQCGGVTACVAGDGCCPSGCTSASDSDCPVAVCGDGVVQPGERCDDGNTANGDGCDPTCSFGNTLSLVSGMPGAPGFAPSTTASRVRFYSARGITTDGTMLYVSDVNSVLWQVDPTSGVTTLLGGAPGVHTTVDAASGTDARFSGPLDVAWLNNTGQSRTELFALESVPNELVGTITGWQVRKMILSDPNHPVSTFLPTTLLTGGLANPVALAAGTSSGSPHLFVLTDSGISSWRSLMGGYGSDSSPAAAAALNSAVYNGGTVTEGNCYDLAYAGGNIMYVGCPRVILKVDFTGSPVVTVVAGTPKSTATCADNATATSATLVHPNALSVDAGGAVWFEDCNTVKKLVVGGGVFTVAGSGVSGGKDATNPLMAQFGGSFAGAVIGTTYFTVEGGARVRSVSPAVRTLAGMPGTAGIVYDPTGANVGYTVSSNLAVDAGGLYSLVFYQRQLFKVDFSNGGSTLVATLPTISSPPGSNFPKTLARVGNKLYIAYEDGEVRQIGTDGTNEQPFAGTPGVTPKVTTLATDGTNLYYVNAVNQIGRLESNGAFTPLAGAASATTVVDGTGAGAKFQAPMGLVVVGNNLYTLDGPFNGNATAVRQIALGAMAAANSGVVTTIAGQAGTAGAADGIGGAARFAGAGDLTSDGKSLFVLDRGNGPFNGDGNGPTVRQVELASGRVTTMIGTRGVWSASPGVGSAATLNTPTAIAFDPAKGDLVLFDESAFFRIH